MHLALQECIVIAMVVLFKSESQTLILGVREGGWRTGPKTPSQDDPEHHRRYMFYQADFEESLESSFAYAHIMYIASWLSCTP
jgi:hypothetical protein